MSNKKTTTKTTKPRATKTKVETLKDQDIVDLTASGTTEDEQSLPAQGLGDTIKSITSALGIQTCTKCEERRKQLNRIFPWLNAKDMPRLQGEDMELMRRVLKTPSHVVNDDVNALFALYNSIYSPKRPVKRCTCPGLLRQIVERLTLLMEED